MTVDGLISTGLVVGSSMILGFGLMEHTQKGVQRLVDKGKQQPKNLQKLNAKQKHLPSPFFSSNLKQPSFKMPRY